MERRLLSPAEDLTNYMMCSLHTELGTTGPDTAVTYTTEAPEMLEELFLLFTGERGE